MDPEGKAYEGIKTSAYQDSLADPFAEEARDLLRDSFPGKTDEEKLSHAAEEAEKFERSPLNPFREGNNNEQERVMALTRLAYNAYKRIHDLWEAAGRNRATIQSLHDAWMRVDLVQNLWAKRLRKIFSAIEMDEDQTFENLPRDLPEPHFYGKQNDLWLPGTVVGCNFRLLSVPGDEDLAAAYFRTILRAHSDGFPVLIRRGEGEEATYHLYAPHVTIDVTLDEGEMKWRDEVEWQMVPVNVPELIELIKWGRTAPEAEVVAPIDFSKQTLPFNPAFDAFYRYGSQHALHLGSGAPYIYAVYHFGGAPGVSAIRDRDPLVECLYMPSTISAKNSGAVSALYEKRKERLHQHLVYLKPYLPKQSSLPKLTTPGS